MRTVIALGLGLGLIGPCAAQADPHITVASADHDTGFVEFSVAPPDANDHRSGGQEEKFLVDVRGEVVKHGGQVKKFSDPTEQEKVLVGLEDYFKFVSEHVAARCGPSAKVFRIDVYIDALRRTPTVADLHVEYADRTQTHIEVNENGIVACAPNLHVELRANEHAQFLTQNQDLFYYAGATYEWWIKNSPKRHQ